MGRVLVSGAWVPIGEATALLARQYQRDKDGKFSSGGGGRMSGDDFDRAVAGAAQGSDAAALARVSPTDSQREALDRYGGGSYDEGNRTLRTNKGDVSSIPESWTKDVVVGMDSALGSHALPGDIVVVRGLASGRRTFGDRTPTVGMEFTDHGFVSTTTNEHPDYTFTGDAGVEMRILVPKGTHAVSHRNLDPGEVVLDRGLTYRIVRDNGVDPYRGTRQLDIEVVGSRHD